MIARRGDDSYKRPGETTFAFLDRVSRPGLACPLVAVRRGRRREDVSSRKRNRAGSKVVAWLEHELCS
jgi:hypothetical protein